MQKESEKNEAAGESTGHAVVVGKVLRWLGMGQEATADAMGSLCKGRVRSEYAGAERVQKGAGFLHLSRRLSWAEVSA